MTGKATMTDGEGPGMRAQRAVKKRWLIYGIIFAVLASALTAGLIPGRRDLEAGFPPFTPEAGVAGAVLLSLLTLVTMWITLRMSDEVQRREIIDAWAATLVIIVLGAISWMFLIGGGLVPVPPGPTVLLAVLGGSGVAAVVAASWISWRRF